uniref:Uncharacterized protein n=1 Tax=Oryza nivara TaxID=4536 RepID=A0A0E0I1Z4_ORYNI
MTTTSRQGVREEGVALTSLFEYHVRKNFPFSVTYVPLSAKNRVFSGVSLYSPASSGNSHSGCPAFAASALKSASSSSMEERLVIHSKGEVLDVPRPTTVGVEDVGVARADIPHPLRDRDVDDVADVTTALVERHDGLQLQPGLLHQPEQLLVGLPVDPGPFPSTSPHHTSTMTPSTPASVSFFSCARVSSTFSNLLSTVTTSSYISRNRIQDAHGLFILAKRRGGLFSTGGNQPILFFQDAFGILLPNANTMAKVCRCVLF